MSYTSLNKAASDIAGLLESLRTDDGVPVLATVRTACAGSYEQILKINGDIGVFPAAIVVIGPGAYDVGMRTLNPGIVILDKLSATAGSQAQSLLTALETILALFEMPAPRMARVIGGSVYGVESFTPLALPSMHAAYLVQLTVTQPLVQS